MRNADESSGLVVTFMLLANVGDPVRERGKPGGFRQCACGRPVRALWAWHSSANPSNQLESHLAGHAGVSLPAARPRGATALPDFGGVLLSYGFSGNP
jgi:hypothetical protein